MLKIKDSVNLKELEKYGFEYNTEIENNPSYYLKINNWHFIDINIKTRKIEVFDDLDFGQQAVEVFYDLVQNNLVEKIN